MTDPVVSFVCVFNDAAVLEKRLKTGVARQTAPNELVAVDNRDNGYRSAAGALNRAAAGARGNWLVFAHQDVELLSTNWAERMLQLAPKVSGWAGVAGRTRSGASAGFLLDREALVCTTGPEPEEVQTLDECVLIRRHQPDGNYFDEGIPGWHAYGVEACLRAARAGERNAALMLPTWHDSKGTNVAGLGEAHQYVWDKHCAAFRVVYTTVGNLGRVPGPKLGRRVWKRLSQWLATLFGFSASYVHGFESALDAAAGSAAEVEVLHPASGLEPIRAQALAWGQPRPVVHRFEGLSESRSASPRIVMPELTAAHLKTGGPPDALIGPPGSVVGVFTEDLFGCLRSWRRLRPRLSGPAIFTTRRNDDSRPVILLPVGA